MPQSTIKRLKARCDVLAKQRTLSVCKCEICGVQNTRLEWAHFIGRRELRLRWHSINNACLCQTDHEYGHKHRDWLKIQWDRIKGPGIVEWLEKESRRPPVPITEEFYRNILEGENPDLVNEG